jgi:phosphate transport system substrate-binding protein
MLQRARAAIATAALLLVTIPQTAPAQDVELRSFDGTVELEGNLIAYDGAYYQIETVYGPLTVSAEGVSCAGPGCPDLTSFVAEAYIAGAATVAEGLLPDLLSAFAAQQDLSLQREEEGDGLVYTLMRPDDQPAARFFVRPGTTDDGFLALLNGEVDIALSLREPDAPERLAARDQAPDDPPLTRRVRVLALDALVPIVSPDNPVTSIEMSELARLFSGEIDSWAALGGPDAPVAQHLLAPGLGPAQDFAGRILLATDRPLADGIIRHDSAADLARTVARDAFAIGISSRSTIGAARSLPLTGPCGFSQSATPDAIKSEDYPLTAPVYLYLAPYRLPLLVRQFLDFTETAEAERIVQQIWPSLRKSSARAPRNPRLLPMIRWSCSTRPSASAAAWICWSCRCRRRGRRVARGVVVHEDQRRGVEFQRALDHLARVDRHMIDGAAACASSAISTFLRSR